MSVKSKVDYASKKTFKYYYQKIIRNSDKSKPVFIIIPGGPGRSAMTNADNVFSDSYTAELTTNTEFYWGLPVKSNIILTSPRSIDCNLNNNLPSSSYVTKNIVQDLVAVIKKEKLTNYIIVGRSYGSVVATRLSYYIENNKDIKNPKAVLLTGVLGHYLDVNTVASDLQLVWGQIYKKQSSFIQKIFPQDISAITDSEDFKFPLDIGAQTWLNMIQYELKIGFNYFSYELALASFLENLGQTLNRISSASAGGHEYLRLNNHLKRLKQEVMAHAPADNTSSQKISDQKNDKEKEISLFESITQKEIYINLGKNPVKKSALWNSNNYQIKKIPVIYFHGSWDTTTTIKNAISHYDGQKVKKNKYFIKANKGGHDVLSGLNSCKTDFWKSVWNNNFNAMTAIIQDCDPNFKLLK